VGWRCSTSPPTDEIVTGNSSATADQKLSAFFGREASVTIGAGLDEFEAELPDQVTEQRAAPFLSVVIAR
jgi:hypothetical protein